MNTRQKSVIPVVIASSLLLLAGVLLFGCAGKREEASTPREAAFDHYKMSLVLMDQKRYTDSRTEIAKAVKMEPSNESFHYQLGVVNFALGDWDAAEQALRGALAINPKNSEAHSWLGAVLSEQGRRDEALLEFQKVLTDRSYETPEKIWVNIALLYDEMNNLDEAIVSYRKALDGNQKYSRAHFGLAQALDKVGRLDDAIAEYAIAENDYNADPEFHYQYGFACFRAHRLDTAKEQFSTVMRNSPGTTAAAKAQELLKLIE